MSEPCGCYFGLDGLIDRIHYCPTHAAAPKLLAALKAIAEHRYNSEEAQRLAGYRNPGTVLRDAPFFARAAIAQATGGEDDMGDVDDNHVEDLA